MENRILALKRTSSAVRQHPLVRLHAPTRPALRTNSPNLRRYSKPADGERGDSSHDHKSTVNNRMAPHVKRSRRCMASSVLTVLTTLCVVNLHSFLTNTRRFTIQLDGADPGRMLRGDNDRALTTTTTIKAMDADANESPLLSSSPSTMGKEPILQLLRDAGVADDLDAETLASLPSWEEVTALYGPAPVLHGLETCATFRASGRDPGEHLLGVAGTFNTGTNLLAELLIHNCEMPARMAKYGAINKGIRWQVPWGKHTPVDDETVRQQHKTQSGESLEADEVFPAITVRDPAVWSASMCRHPYEMEWTHSSGDNQEEPQHCPNFVPNEIDIGLSAVLEGAESIPVSIQYADFIREHDSLLHHWNDYYRAYYDASFPRLMVRYEDLIFFPRQVTEAVCMCAGGQFLKPGQPFQYMVESAKKGAAHGTEKTGYVNAIVKYGNGSHRWKSGGVTDADRQFAVQHLDLEMMQRFGYRLPEETTTVLHSGVGATESQQ